MEIEDAAWTTALPEAEALVRAAAEAALVLPSPLRGGGGGAGCESVALAPKTSSRHPHTQPSPRRGESALEGSLTILLTDDEAVRDLNARFRQQDKPTNVLSFPALQNPDSFLGDVALAYGVCAREAKEQGKPLAHHLQHLVAHGVLHLLGYDHMSDAEAAEMEGLERVVLAGLGVPDPYPAGEGDHDRPPPVA